VDAEPATTLSAKVDNGVPIQVSRSRVERRLQKLEAQLTDGSQLVPHTKRWLIYWTERLGKYMTREIETMNPLMPLEAWDAVRDACEADQVDSPYARIIRGDDNRDAETQSKTP
jgi:hypothetical protein